MRHIVFVFLMLSLLVYPQAVLSDEPPAPVDVMPVGALTTAPGPIFSEDFSSNAAGWSLDSTTVARRSITGGAYHIALYQPNMLWSAEVPSRKFSDFTLQVDATLAAGPDATLYGVLFRSQDARSFYLFGITGKGEYRADRVQDRQYATTSQNTALPAAAINPAGAPSTLKVVANGASFDVYANGVKLASQTDATFSTGSIELFVSSPVGLAGSDVAFDNLQIWSGVAPDAGSPSAAKVTRGKSLFAETFANNTNNWPLGARQGYGFRLQNGGYHIYNDEASSFTLATLPGQYTDFVLDVTIKTMKPSDNVESGLLFRRLDSDNFYRLSFNPTGAYIFDKQEDGLGETIIPWTKNTAIQAQNNVTVVAKGNSFSFYINGVWLATETDDSFKVGKIALYDGMFEGTATSETRFENIQVWEIGSASVPSGASAKLIFSDDLANNSSGWNIVSDDIVNQFVRGGSYHIEVLKPGYRALQTMPVPQQGDFAVQVDAVIAAGPSNAPFGMTFRYQDAQNYYRYELSRDGSFRLVKRQAGQESDMIAFTNAPSRTVRPGSAANTLGIVAKGSTLDLYINGVKVGSASDSTFKLGYLGLFLTNPAGGSTPAEAMYTKVRVWDGLPASW